MGDDGGALGVVRSEVLGPGAGRPRGSMGHGGGGG